MIGCQVKRCLVDQRENAVVNRLNKTKTENFPDLREEKECRLKELRQRDRETQLKRVSPHPHVLMEEAMLD